MSSKETHPIRNGIVATVLGGVLLSFWPPFRGFLANALSWVWSVLEAIWLWLFSPHELYGWLLALLIALSVVTLIKLLPLVIGNRQPSAERSYTADQLFGADWTWSYFQGSIHNLWCLCPKCKGELIYSEFRPNPYSIDHAGREPKTDFTCEKCDAVILSLKGNLDFALGTVQREIRRKIRSNEWQNELSS